VITGNPSITSLNDQIAPQFVVGQAYSEGDLVNHDGVVYVFTADYAGGSFANAPVSSTNVATQIELLPDKIIHYVGQQGYSKTYIQPTDPTLDPDKDVTIGDFWIVGDAQSTWGVAKNSTWGQTKEREWGSLAGYKKTFCWDGTKWILVNDLAQEATAFTRITQTQYMIQQEVYRANAAEGELYSSIEQTADAISAEISRSTSAEERLESRITQTAVEITSEVTRATAAEGTLSSRITQNATSISSEVSRATTAEGSLSTRITQNANSITSEVTRAKSAESTMSTKITQNANSISAEVTRATTAEGTMSSNITANANAISAEVTRATTAEGTLSSNITANANAITAEVTRATTAEGTKYTQVSGITITSSGIDISGSQYVKIASGGYFQVTTGNFGINTNASDYVLWSGASTAANSSFWIKKDGSFKATSGTIGDWTATTGRLYASSGTTKVVLDSSSTLYPLSGTTSPNSKMYAFWCGSDNPNTAPFSVTKDGIVTIQSLRVKTDTNEYTTVDMTKWTSTDTEGGDTDPMSEAMGKLKFQTVKSITSNADGTTTIKITNGNSAGTRTVTFNGAASVSARGSWSGSTFTATPKIYKDGAWTDAGGSSTSTTISGAWTKPNPLATNNNLFVVSANNGGGDLFNSGEISVTKTYQSNYHTYLLEVYAGSTLTFSTSTDSTAYTTGVNAVQVTGAWDKVGSGTNDNRLTISKVTSGGLSSLNYVVSATAGIVFNDVTCTYQATAVAKVDGVQRGDTSTVTSGLEAAEGGFSKSIKRMVPFVGSGSQTCYSDKIATITSNGTYYACAVGADSYNGSYSHNDAYDSPYYSTARSFKVDVASTNPYPQTKTFTCTKAQGGSQWTYEFRWTDNGTNPQKFTVGNTYKFHNNSGYT